jgi:hypothetical protein
MQGIQGLRERENKVSPSQCILGISTINRVARKSGRIAEVLQVVLAIPASPVNATNPGDSNPRPQRKIRGRALDDLTYDLMARNQPFA